MFNRSLTPDAEENWALPRRDFLVLGSVAVLGAAASSVTAATLSVVAAPHVGAVLSVGFTESIAPVVAGNEAATSSVVRASSLRASDASLRQSGVRVLVHGFSERANGTPVSVRLSTFAPVAGGAVPFLAWTHSTGRNGLKVTSPRAAFVAALDENGTLPVAIERDEPARRWSRLVAQPAPAALPDLAALEQAGSVCRLSSGSTGDVRLREGTYFIALRRTSSDRQPDWSAITVDATVADASTALRRNGVPVDFEYVAVTITNPTV